MIQSERIVIVGAGPAGIAAAIELKRGGLDPLLIEKQRVGGLLVNARRVENYPGFPDGISGLDLVDLMGTHLKKLGVNPVFEPVTDIDLEQNRFAVKTPARTVRSEIVVIAAGTRPRRVTRFEIAAELKTKIMYEVYPIRRAKGKSIVIVGAGDAAFDYALSLHEHNQVTILNRRDKPKCLPLLWERVMASGNITYMKRTEVYAIDSLSDDRVSILCRNLNGDLTLSAHHILFAIGREPELGFLSSQLGEVLEQREQECAIHLIGDVRTGRLRQTAIAVGDGIEAAMRIRQKLEESS
jgi:thioredoxin reductase (NADPH)